ncbi:MAG: cytochrome-c oxidase, cbb3-type subunit II, partial [Myxococcales bacterium]|nr:cytochrome-c oxidase, cbb3-type subunit II [Myxococcales bacterium]
WFYIATIITVAVLHIVNSLALPVLAGIKSYSIYAGVQDALVQWWYGHNAVAFFLTTPILGIMYYFLPKAAGRPVYSYRLSIVHFWALVFLYIWAGPHHLLYTSLPDWAQSLGMIFSLMLWAPSWGGMINGLLTLRGAWHLLRTEPVIKFLIAGVTFYGMATFEGPLLSIKAVSALGHYTDWIIGHVHTGALGWNGLMAAGMIYWLVPRLWGKPLASKSMANTHFWLATIGILLYAISMWTSGISQGLMWRALTDDGALMYPSFVETTGTIWPMYIVRGVGGTLYLAGFVLLFINVFKTVRGGKATDVTVTVTEHAPEPKVPWRTVALHPALVLTYLGILVSLLFFMADITGAVISLGLIVLLFIGGLAASGRKVRGHGEGLHRLLEGKPLLFTVLVTLAILVGGVAELIPTMAIKDAVPKVSDTQLIATPYTPLELLGRDIYVREGCYVCHSQQIRPFVSEVLRYGDASTATESIYDHPFQWGSKRTGPDLARVGGKYPNLWHMQHMIDPRILQEDSIMPSYAFMAENTIDIDDTAIKMKAMQTLGVPYTNDQIGLASRFVEIQGRQIADDLASQGEEIAWDSELVAIIAFLQRLGKQPADPLGDLIKPANGEVSSANAHVPFERTVPGAPRLNVQAPAH